MSVKSPPATEIEPIPDCVLVVGVNTAVYTDEEVVANEPMVPPETVMSPTTKSGDASEMVKVNVSVCPDLRVPDPARDIETVGAVVSMVVTSAVVDVCVSVTPSNVAVAVERTL